MDVGVDYAVSRGHGCSLQQFLCLSFPENPPVDEAHQSCQPQCQTFCCPPCWSEPGLRFETSPPQYYSYSPGTSSLWHTGPQLGDKGEHWGQLIFYCSVGVIFMVTSRSFETYNSRFICKRLLKATCRIMLCRKKYLDIQNCIAYDFIP